MYGYQDEPKYSMTFVARILNIGRSTLFSGLRTLGILNQDNTPKKEYTKNGLIEDNISIYSRTKYHGTVPTTKATQDGINFIDSICKQHSELFKTKKSLKGKK